jgi:acetyl esterase/lipase
VGCVRPAAQLGPPGHPLSTRRRYGAHRSQVVETFAPGDKRIGTAVLLHGGFWRVPYGRGLMRGLAADLARRGWWVWNAGYRRVGEGGGWPATFDDVAAAVDLAAAETPAGEPLVVIGHSAGGHLALWAARRPGVTHAVAQAGVVDLAAAAELGLSRGAADELVGGRRELFALASPAAEPASVPQLLVHGDADGVVPAAISRGYERRARETGAPVDLVEIAAGEHLDHLDPDSEAWRAVVRWLPG